MSAFWQISFELGADAEAAERACLDCGASSITLVDAHDDPVLEPLPGELRLWPTTRLCALFDAAVDVPRTIARLAELTGLDRSAFAAQAIESRAWEREWLRDFHAMRFGRRLWVCPHHERVAAADAVVVSMDPGLAFGTGTHPTTAMCLEWLDANFRAGDSAIDYGCGSGILGVAAAKLGAAVVHAFDIDPQALLATRDNATANAVDARLQLCSAADDLPSGRDVLLANILSGPLCELAPTLSRLVRRGGAIVLAGLLQHEACDVTRAYGACFDMHSFGRREGWVGLSGTRY